MFRLIPPRRIPTRARHSLLVLSTISRPSFKHLSLRTVTQPSPVYLYPSILHMVSKSLFSTTRPRSIDETEKKKKFEELQNSLGRKFKVEPGNVTTCSSSSLAPVFDSRPTNRGGSSDDLDMFRGLKSDLRIVKETFELKEVPKEVLYIGMGGLIPYLGTSLSALYLAWDINYSADYGTGFLVSRDTAEHLLHILEPLQIGLGATILSFLGAVHWGLEMAEYGGKHPYKRYSLSILAPMLAWPTLMLPIDYALLAQFVGFTGMYFADSTATTNGWAPRWYMTYRFLLTFVVGASIIMTLIARGQIGERVSRVKAPASYIKDLRDLQREKLQKGEEERKRIIKKEAAKANKVMKEDVAAVWNKNGGGDEDDTNEGKDTKGARKKGDEDWGKDDKTTAGPGKREDDDKPGVQGAHLDKQGSGDSKSAGVPETASEKEVAENPKLEAKNN